MTLFKIKVSFSKVDTPFLIAGTHFFKTKVLLMIMMQFLRYRWLFKIKAIFMVKVTFNDLGDRSRGLFCEIGGFFH